MQLKLSAKLQTDDTAILGISCQNEFGSNFVNDYFLIRGQNNTYRPIGVLSDTEPIGVKR